MSVRFVVDNRRALTAIFNLGKDIEAELKKSVMRSAIKVHGSMVDMTANAGTGRLYQKYNPRRTHRASRAGSAPARDTGDLVTSLFWLQEPDGLTAWVGTNINYGAHLEFGTLKMEARPFIRPATEMNRMKIQVDFREAIKRGMRKSVSKANQKNVRG